MKDNHIFTQEPNNTDTSPVPPSLSPRSSATLQRSEKGETKSDLPRQGEVTVSPPDLAKDPHILDRFVEAIGKCGLVGEERAVQLIYLVVTSRVLEKPIPAVLKGPSSAGKNYVPQQTLRFFPESAYYSVSALSEKALAYDQEPLSHRVLVIAEAAGVAGDFATYLIRTLLSEGRIHYVTVESTKKGLSPKTLKREGPTGLLISTTAIHLHPENETRLLSIPISDTQEQTQRVFEILASDECVEQPDLSEWIAFQLWIEKAEHRVLIPYAKALAQAVPPIAVRLRRDFKTLLGLVKTHAILHQETRERDSQGRIIASIEDYCVIRRLIQDLLAEGVGLCISLTVRETVEAVRIIIARKQANKWATVIEVASELRLDKSSASRRVKAALQLGYLDNKELGRGKPYRLVLGEPLPQDRELLPKPEQLIGCTVAVKTEEGRGYE